MTVGPQGVAQHKSVAAVVLGAGHGEAVAKAVELLGIDGKGGEAVLVQAIDHGAARHLDGDRDRRRRGATGRHQPVAQSRQPRPAVGKGPLPKDHAGTVHQADLMRLGRPVDAGKALEVIMHRFTPFLSSDRRDAHHSLYWRSQARLPTGALHHGRPPGHASPAGAHRRRA